MVKVNIHRDRATKKLKLYKTVQIEIEIERQDST